MRSPTLLLALGLLGLAAADSPTSFDGELGADGGFFIPAGTPDGIYMVHVTADGLAHQELVANVTAIDPAAPSSSPEDLVSGPGGGAVLRKRDWRRTCGGGYMDRASCDAAVNGLADYCGSWGRLLPEYYHAYVMSRGVAAFYCNYQNLRNWCYASDVRGAFQEVTNACGSYREGWIELWPGTGSFPPPMESFGYHNVNERIEFCGRAHA